MERRNSTTRLVVFIMVGLILGGVLGEVLGHVLGQIGVISGGGIDNPVRNFFVKAFEPSFGIKQSQVIDLYMIKLRLGLGLKFNVCSILGMIASLYVMKWSR
jgi:hypothetical protein